MNKWGLPKWVFIVPWIVAGLVFMSPATPARGGSTVPERAADVPGAWQVVDLGTTATLRDASWYRPGLGYVVGDGGTVILVDKQTPGDFYLQTLNIGTSANLFAVDTYVEDKGCLAGSSGTLYCLVAKKTWQPRSLGTSATLYDISFVREPVAGLLPGVGWVVGEQGVIRRTTDHGTSWTVQDLPGYVFYAVYAQSPTDAWVGGQRQSDGFPVLLHTGDGGTIWQLQYVGTTAGSIRALHGYGGNVWAAGDNGLLLHTTDQGANWQAIAVGSGVNWTGIWQAPDASVDGGGDVWLVGQGGIILRSPDEGNTWGVETSGTSANLWNVAFFNAYHGDAAVGDNGLFLWREAQKRRLQAYWAETPPTMDGDLSEWEEAPYVRLNAYTAEFSGYIMNYNLNDYDVWARAAWDANYLYFAFDIHDDVIREDNTPAKPYYDDELEITLDGPPIGIPDQGDAWPDGTDHQYTVNPSGFVTDLGNPAWITPGSIDIYTRTTPAGWTVEMRIRKDELGLSTLAAGTQWGFTWGYHDDDEGPPGSSWDTYYVWEGYKTYPDSSAVLAGYGTLELRSQQAPWVPTPTPTPTMTPTPTPTATPTLGTGAITGQVFEDQNRNGAFDPGEQGVEGALVRVLRNGSLLQGETTTGSDGRFSFPALEPGNYAISESPPPGYTSTTSRVQWVTLNAGDVLLIYFGEAPLPTATPTPTPTPATLLRYHYLPLCIKGQAF